LRLSIHTILGSSTLRDSRILCATCTLLTLRYGPHCSSCRDIAFSRPRDLRGQILGPFLARSRDTIPRADPTVLLCSESNGCPSLTASRPHDFEYQMFGLSTYELPSSQDHRSIATCPPQMDGYKSLTASSPRVLVPHDFEHPILGFSLCELSILRDRLISCHLSLKWTAHNLLSTFPLMKLKGFPLRPPNV